MNGMRRVGVRRDRPGWLALAIAFLVTALAVYLLTLPQAQAGKKKEAVFAGTSEEREISFADMEVTLVTFGQFADVQSARIETARHTARGAAGLVWQIGDAYYAVGAAYPRADEAQYAAARLLQEEGLNAQAVTVHATGARLRVTADADRIDALADAEARLRDYYDALRDISARLDAGELDVAAAESLLAVLRADVQDCAHTLAAATDAATHAAAVSLNGLMTRFLASFDDISRTNAKIALPFSSEIKYNYITGVLRHAAYLTALSGNAAQETNEAG